MGRSLISQKATGSAANAMAIFTGLGRQGFMGKEQDILPVLARGLTSYAPTAMTLMSRNLNP
jgi:hypothetical protein